MEDVYGTEFTDAEMMPEEVIPETTEDAGAESEKSGAIDAEMLTDLFRAYGLMSASEDGISAETVQAVDNSEYLQVLHEDFVVTIYLLIFIAGFQALLFGMSILVFIYRVIANNVTRYI